MIYDEFCKAAIKQDSRNVFGTYDTSLPIAEQAGIAEFYKKYDPVDVEFLYDGLPVVFFPAEELNNAKAQYEYVNPQLVFAQSNSDPIFLKDGAVYTCPHGVSKPEPEWLADSFEKYLKMLIQ